MSSDWGFVEMFCIPSPHRHRWSEIAPWCESANRAAAERTVELQPLVVVWDERLASLGGDPSTRNWSRFRPLRLSREEDWSDWLAELISSSKSGRFARELLNPSFDDPFSGYVMPTVLREVSAGRRRADVLIHHPDQRSFVHIEVKIGDRSFAKTTETGASLCAKLGGTVRDYVLLPEASVEAWTETMSQAGCAIKVITWRDVVVALRRALWERADDPIWTAWAYAFVGCVERKILGIDHVGLRSNAISLRLSSSAVRWAEILRVAKDEGGE